MEWKGNLDITNKKNLPSDANDEHKDFKNVEVFNVKCFIY